MSEFLNYDGIKVVNNEANVQLCTFPLIRHELVINEFEMSVDAMEGFDDIVSAKGHRRRN